VLIARRTAAAGCPLGRATDHVRSSAARALVSRLRKRHVHTP